MSQSSPNCCVCAAPHQNCSRCSCVAGGRRCTNCRRGGNCRNSEEQTQEEEENVVGHERVERNAGGGQLQRGAGQENDAEQNRVERDADGGHLQVGAGNREGEINPDAGRQEEPNMRRFWQGRTTEVVEEWLSNAYTQIVAFSPRNLFTPPNCNATKGFIEEKTHLIREYNSSSPIAPVALKILAVLPHLICQRTHRKSKTRENVKAMERRMEQWKRGEVDQLLKEAKSLQDRTQRKTSERRNVDKARQFADNMRHGNVAAATRSLAEGQETSGVLPLNEEIRRSLKEKHPNARQALPETKFDGEYLPPHQSIFDRITGETIWKHALHTQGAAGPSGMDAKGWKTILSSNTFGTTASDLCDAIAALARKIATDECQHLEAYVACRLVPFAKKDGCRPIGIGEVLRRIVGKAVMEVVKEDVRRAAGNLQVCAGHQAGCEAAIHSMRRIFENPECEAVLMVDASNAFNSINREATIHNIRVKCPAFARYVENTYKEPAQLFISSGVGDNKLEVIQSSEGTTQGDPVAMAVYALGLLKLQQTLRHGQPAVKQVAYADDLIGAGKIKDIRKWWDMICEHGPKIGYSPNATKSQLVVKPELYDLAKDIFTNTDVEVTDEGARHLGAVIGSDSYREKIVKETVEGWVNEVKKLSNIAKTEPQAAYAAFTYGVKHKWNYLMRTIPNIGPLLEPLEQVIRGELLPAISNGHNPNDQERRLLELPPRMGGLGIPNPKNIAEFEFQNSLRLTASLTERIVSQDEQQEVDTEEIRAIRKEITKERENKQKLEQQNISELLQDNTKRKVEMAQEVGASNWLTTLPIREKGFSLNKQEFTDAIALRYGWPLDSLPIKCACGIPFDTTHALTCKKGGFICIRHDEVRNHTAQMLREVCRDVAIEPTLLPMEGERLEHRTANSTNEARVDVSARGFWTRGQRAFFDVRIFDPTAHCYRDLSLEAAHRRNEQEKVRKYEERIQHIDQGSFTPLIFTTSGGMGPRAKAFYARLAELLAEKKRQPRSSVVLWMRCRLSFSLLRSALLCLRGTRSIVPRSTNVTDLDMEATVVDSRIHERLD